MKKLLSLFCHNINHCSNKIYWSMSSGVAEEVEEACSHVQQLRTEAQNSLEEAKEVDVKQQAGHEKIVVNMASLRKSHKKKASYHFKTPPSSRHPPTMRPLCPGKAPNSANKRKYAMEPLSQNFHSNLHKADQLATLQNDTEYEHHATNEKYKVEILLFTEVQSKYIAFITVQHEALRRKHAELVQSHMKDTMANTQTTEDLKLRLTDSTGANSNLKEKLKRMRLDMGRICGLEVQALENSNRSLQFTRTSRYAGD